VAFDPGDPLLSTWILWWNAQAVPFTPAWWSPPIFHPMPDALALSEHYAGVGLFTTPMLRLGGTPALAYNTALLLSSTLSGFFTYLLVRRVTGSTLAALCGGVAYALAPVRAGQLSHLQVLTSQWLPLMLLGMHAHADTGRRAWLVLFGAAWLLQAPANGYYLLFAPILVVSWICWFLLAHGRWRAALELTGAWALASIPLVPVLLKYREVHAALGLSRSREDILHFSATAGSFLNPPPMLALWPARAVPAVEDFLFPGLTILLLVLAAIPFAMTRRSAHRLHPPLRSAFFFYALTALLMAALTLGPAAPGEGASGWLRPYEWLIHLPGFDGLRVPVRFAMLMALGLSIAGGIGLAMMMPASQLRRALLVAGVCGGLAADGAIEPLTGSPPPGRVDLPDAPSAAVLELPPDDAVVNVGAMFRSMTHRRPLVNGYSGHVPPHYDILGQALRRQDPSPLVELARGRNLLILVAERHDPAGAFRRLVESIPGVTRGHVTGAGVSYLLSAQPHLRRPLGGAVHQAAATLLPREHAVLDLGAPRVVRALEFPLRRRYPDVGRRFAIEVSGNGLDWTTAWEGWTGGTALAGALEDQVRVAMRFGLPDVTTRYLRIHPAPAWLVQDLIVRGL
jgi:hypothetical protein